MKLFSIATGIDFQKDTGFDKEVMVEWTCPITNASIRVFKFAGDNPFHSFHALAEDHSFLGEFSSFMEAKNYLKEAYSKLNLPKMGRPINQVK